MDEEHQNLTVNSETEEQPEVFAVSQDEGGLHFSRREFIEMAGVTAAGVAVVSGLGVTLLDAPQTVFAQQRTPTRTPGKCTVRTSEADVRVHVGPGRNRGVRRFMPVNEDVPVLGKAEDAEGNLWWKVELPNIEQAWVADEDVTTKGDCEAVEAADIPDVVRRPTPTQQTSGNNTTNGNTGGNTNPPPGVPGQVQPGQTGINYSVNGQTFTLPCGSPIPAGAVCVCNCVSEPAPVAPCTCDSVCTCDTVCSCNGYCSCDAQGGHYWYPN